LLLKFYNDFIIDKVIPTKLNTSIIKPIIKDQKKSTSDTNNIRPISISNCLAQIFEKLILSNSPKLHKSHKNQFGFKPKTSCNHAIFTIKETVLSYIQHRSSCKIASLDAEKAFDKVWRDGLFHKLKAKLSYTYWFLLKTYYNSSKAIILNENRVPFNEFSINCGVKQGGILSPYLFNAFIDDLINEVTQKNIGATFQNLNVSIIVYADDILLISPVGRHLQLMLDICSKYSKDWLIKFNPLKSNIITFGEQIISSQKFKISNLEIKNTDKLEYLGIEINNKLDSDQIIIDKFRKVEKSIFSISYLGLTPKGVNPDLKSFLYKTYCLSQFTYGIETTTLKQNTIDHLNVAQNSLVRQFIGLERNCHMKDVLKSLEIYNINELYIKSKLSFLNTIKNNELCLGIFNHLCADLNNVKKNSKSFDRDIVRLQDHFNMDIELMFAGPARLKYVFRDAFNEENGLTDSIKLCLSKQNNKHYKKILNDLIRPQYLQEYFDLMHDIIDS